MSRLCRPLETGLLGKRRKQTVYIVETFQNDCSLVLTSRVGHSNYSRQKWVWAGVRNDQFDGSGVYATFEIGRSMSERWGNEKIFGAVAGASDCDFLGFCRSGLRAGRS